MGCACEFSGVLTNPWAMVLAFLLSKNPNQGNQLWNPVNRASHTSLVIAEERHLGGNHITYKPWGTKGSVKPSVIYGRLCHHHIAFCLWCLAIFRLSHSHYCSEMGLRPGRSPGNVLIGRIGGPQANEASSTMSLTILWFGLNFLLKSD